MLLIHIFVYTYNGYKLYKKNGYKLYKNYCHLNVRKYTFSQRIINDWNNLPRDIIQSPDVVSFKSKLDVYWQDLCFRFLE